MNRRQIGILLVKFILTAVVIYIVTRTIPITRILERFNHLNWFWVGMGGIALAFELGFAAWKIHWMAGKFSYFWHFRLVIIKVFVNQLLPGGMGGEAVRIMYLGRHLESHGRAAGISLADRWSGLCGQTLWSGISVLGFYVFHLSSQNTGLSTVILGATAIACGALGWFIGPHLLAWLVLALPWTKKLTRLQALGEQVQSFADEIKSWGRFNRRGLRLLGMTSLNQISFVILILTANRALGQELNPWLASPILLMGSLAALIPATLGTWGIQEGLFGLAYRLAGYSPDHGVGVSLMIRLLLLLPTTLGALFFLRGLPPKGRQGE